MDKQDSGFVPFLKNVRRPSVDEYFVMMAGLVSTRGTCVRRRCGCVLVDRNNHVLATGYNGVAAGLRHCIDVPCGGANLPSGQGLSACESLHAEENAIIQCHRVEDIYTVYCTASPCIHCVRRIMNTGARRIVFAEIYPHPESELLWTERLDRKWTHLPWTALPFTANTLAER